MDFVRSNNLSLKYQRFITSICKDIRNRRLEFVAETQFLYNFVEDEKISIIIIHLTLSLLG